MKRLIDKVHKHVSVHAWILEIFWFVINFGMKKVGTTFIRLLQTGHIVRRVAFFRQIFECLCHLCLVNLIKFFSVDHIHSEGTTVLHVIDTATRY